MWRNQPEVFIFIRRFPLQWETPVCWRGRLQHFRTLWSFIRHYIHTLPSSAQNATMNIQSNNIWPHFALLGKQCCYKSSGSAVDVLSTEKNYGGRGVSTGVIDRSLFVILKMCYLKKGTYACSKVVFLSTSLALNHFVRGLSIHSYLNIRIRWFDENISGGEVYIFIEL